MHIYVIYVYEIFGSGLIVCTTNSKDHLKNTKKAKITPEIRIILLMCESLFSKGLTKMEIIAIVISFPQEVEIKYLLLKMQYTSHTQGPEDWWQMRLWEGEIICVIGNVKIQGEMAGIGGGAF